MCTWWCCWWGDLTGKELSSRWDGPPWSQQTWAVKRGLAAVPLSQEGAESPFNTMWPGLRSTSVPSDIFIHPAVCGSSSIQPFGHNRHRPKIGGLRPLLGEGELGPHLTQCCLGWGLSPCQMASSSIQPFGHNRYGRKIGGALPPFGEEELGPYLTQCGQGRGLPAYQVSSWPIQPFGHSTPTSQAGQRDNSPIKQGEPFYKWSPKKGPLEWEK